ncbi:ribonuclease FAU-1 family protein [Flindersiella endophytica]
MPLDHDFHPREDHVRVFDLPPGGVLRLDDEVFVAQVRYDDVVLRHFAFRDHWFKINVTTDLSGELIETASSPGVPAYAYTIDLATPMLRDGDAVYAVDLEVDVLVRADGSTYVVTDIDDFRDSIRRGWISGPETRGVRTGLDELTDLIEGGGLLKFCDHAFPWGAAPAPLARPQRTVPLSDVPQLQLGKRLTWTAESTS